MIKAASIYLSSSIISKAIPFLMLPVLTRYLSPEEYGLIAIFQLLVTFTSPFIGMSLNSNITRKFYKLSQDDIAAYIYNIYLILFLSFSIVSIVFAIAYSLYDQVLGVPNNWLLSVPILSLMNTINVINLTILRNREKPIAYGSFEIVGAVISVAATLLLIVGYNMGWEGRLWALVVTSGVLSAIAFWVTYYTGYLRIGFSATSTREILSISIPLIPHMLGGALLAISDRFFLDLLVDKTAVGLYSVGYMFGSIVMVFSDAFIKAWSPWFYKKVVDPKDADKLTIVKFSYLYALALSVMAILISLLSYYSMVLIVGEDYIGARDFVVWVAAGYLFHGFYKIVLPYQVHVGQTRFIALSTMIAASFNVVANYFLISMNGAIGAAQATFLAYIVWFIFVFWRSQHLYPMPWIAFFGRRR
ncbi:oligosaccharide flippase family protein [Aestuariirhabdus sp. LZHN29]|uniref:oligosaccharide flippase family protein n=1 Tax=Aestuariirhabdus sp. LZHN29 TaxID=3417462 RepID=UPI003CF7679C